jgi:nucleoside-diphosphate-sugar epimerase
VKNTSNTSTTSAMSSTSRTSTVLVTGGAGYIGSHAVKSLVKAGQKVVIYDNLSAGHREAALRAGGGAAVLVEGDIGDSAAVRRAVEEHGVDAVMHFAAWLSVGSRFVILPGITATTSTAPCRCSTR